MPDRIGFGEALRRVRTARKLTQGEVATRARLTRTTIVRLEGGLRPGPQARQRIVAAFGFTNLTELFAAAGEPKATRRLKEFAAASAAPAGQPAASKDGRMKWGAA